MIITRTALPRRTFLRGAGVALALPLLDAMVPALTALARTPGQPVRRVGFVYVPNGAAMPYWTPKGEGTAFELSPVLTPLAPFRDRLLVVSGLAQKQAESLGDGNGEHTRASAVWLNGVHPKWTEGADVRAGTTADQLAARVLGEETPLASLELAIEPNFLVGNCDSGYSCVYMNTIAWRTPTTPLPMENNPRAAFERLFGGGGGGGSAARLAQMRKDRSVLDSVTDEIQRLQQTLGPRDRGRVVQYLDAVREIERRIARIEQRSGDAPLPGFDQPPVGVPETYDEHVKVMFDLLALAYQVDITRVFTFMLGREVSPRTYNQIGVPDPHHGLSHHQNDPDKIARLSKINTYHVQLLAHFVEKLRSTADGDGTLLDHAMILYGAGISDSNLHNHIDLPLVLVGGGAGRLQGGRHLTYPKDTPMTNLLVSMLDKAGARVDSFGDSTGRLELEPLSGV